jgi:hypothetical protein
VKVCRASTDFATVDRETYRLYLEQKWDSVTIVGKKGIKEGVDYFYLRLRMGIAYYWQKKYLPAVEHLNRAREFNSSDPIAIEFLYMAYLAAGKVDDANALSSDMPQEMKQRLKVEYKLFDKIHLEGGYTFSSDSKTAASPYLMGSDSIYGEQDLYGNHSYYNLALDINLTPRINLTFAYNYLNFKKTEYFQYSYTQEHLDSTTNFLWGYANHYSWNQETSSYSTAYTVKQHELFLGSSIQLANGLKIKPAFHYLYVSYPEISSTYNGKTVTDTLAVNYVTDQIRTYSYERSSYSYQRKKTRLSNYLASITITKDFSRFTSGLSASYSNLNFNEQVQVGWSLTWFPLGNTNFYGYTHFIGFFEGEESRLIFQQHIGGKVLPRVWLDASAIIGNLTNANLSNGYIIYNNTGNIKYRLGLAVDFTITKHLGLTVNYQYFKNESAQLYYLEKETQNQQINAVQATQFNPYQTHTLIGGITWKF